MSASCCWVVMGVLFLLDDDEVEAVEARRHPQVVRARRHGIGTFLFANADSAKAARLVIGAQIGSLGPEALSTVSLDMASMIEKHSHIEARLREAGFSDDVKIHLLWDQD